MTNDEKWFEKKMDRREFLKKAGIGGAGLALGVSGASAFFANKAQEEKKISDGGEEISFYGEHQAGITTPMQKNIYFVVLDLHSTDKEEVIQMFKDWTDYSSKLVDGELVKKDGSNALLPPSDTGETVGLNPYRLTLTFGVSADFLKKMGLEKKRPKEFRDLPPFPKEQLQEKYTGGDIVIQACADDEQVAFHAVRNLVRKARNTVTMKWSQSGFAAIGDRMSTPRNLFGFKDGTANVTKEKDFDKVIEVNLKSVFNMTKAVQRVMLKQRKGSIINMSSVVGVKGNAGQSNYAASKAGIIGFTKSIALELGSRNIRCNAIAPGFIETEMTAVLDEKVVQGWRDAIPLKRGGQPEDVANACVFLASDMSAYITGQVLNVDGGMLT